MEGEGEDGGALDDTQVKKIILQFEKKALKNQVRFFHQFVHMINLEKTHKIIIDF